MLQLVETEKIRTKIAYPVELNILYIRLHAITGLQTMFSLPRRWYY